MLSPNLARIQSFEVVPVLPPPIAPLLDIAYNVWWSWHPEAVALFRRIDAELWDQSNHNPVQMLGRCAQSRLDVVAHDEGFLSALQHVLENLARHLDRTPWLKRYDKDRSAFTIAYFCAEFGLTECLQIYSGGLGCLAGDHLKSASALGLPLVGVGLLYRHGYFQQQLNADGWQQEYYPDLDFANLPVTKAVDEHGRQVVVTVELPGREVHIAVWRVKVGRVNLYLLDTNLSGNDSTDRDITGHLYGGDMEMRIKQELVLGIGGVRALEALGIRPDICHMNEGHSAFLALERIRGLIDEYDLSFDDARPQAAASHVFTTHTPVAAGIDRFPPDMMRQYFAKYHDSLRLDLEGLLALGRENVFAKKEFFSMAVLAIRTASWANGVSALHGNISRSMWQNIWPGIPEEEIPITHVTNGVHARSWMSGELMNLLHNYLGDRWHEDPSDQTIWAAINEVPDEELWRIRVQCRRNLVIWARQALRQYLLGRGADSSQADIASEALDPDALTIGFARRFATYKRGDLLLHDPDRLRAMLDSVERPIQFIIAGKAHPADLAGKELIRQLLQFARQDEMHRRILFLENYDINVARYLVQGCDVWLNTPRRGMEASGTSGMKAALNGVLNCSILDGWWDEAYQAELGWAIGRGEAYANPDAEDEIDSGALYDLFEKHLIPTFYDRDEHGVPRRWIARVKACISTLTSRFNTHRMVQEYVKKLYLPALDRSRKLAENSMAGSIDLAHQLKRLRAAWSELNIEEVGADMTKPLGVGDRLELDITVHLGLLRPQEVRVQMYVGQLDNDGQIRQGKGSDLRHERDLGGGCHRFIGAISAQTSGQHGFAIRIVPGGDMFDEVIEPGLIHWDRLGPGGEPEVKAGSAAESEAKPAAESVA